MTDFVRTNDTGARPSCCPYCESPIPFGLYATCGRDACLAHVLERGPRARPWDKPAGKPSPEHAPDRSREALFAVAEPEAPEWRESNVPGVYLGPGVPPGVRVVTVDDARVQLLNATHDAPAVVDEERGERDDGSR